MQKSVLHSAICVQLYFNTYVLIYIYMLRMHRISLEKYTVIGNNY